MQEPQTAEESEQEMDDRYAGKTPEYMVTYLCLKCNIDSARTEIDPPECFGCGNMEIETMQILEKKKITAEVMAERLKKVTDRMMENLKGAYFAGKDDPNGDFDEDQMLKLLEKVKNLRDDVQGLELKEPDEKSSI